MGFSTLSRSSFVPPWFFGSGYSGILFHHHVLVPPGSRKGCGACLPSVVALCSIMISSFLLVPARVPGLVSLLFFSFLSQEEDCVPSWFSGSFWFWGRVAGLVSLLFLRVFFQEWGAQWILYCAWTSWKHGLLLLGVYAGVILFLFSSDWGFGGKSAWRTFDSWAVMLR